MKKIIKIIFIAVFIATIILGGWILLNQPNDDILYNKMDWIITIFMLAPVLITEFEIYSICTYGFTKEKNKTITILKVLHSLSGRQDRCFCIRPGKILFATC